MRPAALLLLLAPPLAAAPPALTVAPAGGGLFTVTASSPAKFRADGVAVLTAADGRSVAFFAPAGGVTVYAAPTDPAPLADVASVRVGGTDPAPVPPPKPNPPAPVPVPPDDPLARRVLEAFAADKAGDPYPGVGDDRGNADPDPAKRKAEGRRRLAALYGQFVPYCGDAGQETAGQLMATLKKAADAYVHRDLMGVRTLVAEELKRCLPTDPDEPLSQTNRAAAADLFRRLAAALGGS